MYMLTKRLAFILLMFITTTASLADDIDILGEEAPYNSNVLFIMDLSGSMNFSLHADRPPLFGFGETRLDVLRGAFQDIINDDKYKHINVGLSVFSGGYQNSKGGGLGHGISYPIAPLVGKPAQEVLSKRRFTHPGNSYMPAAGNKNTRQYLTSLSSDRGIWNAQQGTPIVDALYEAVLYYRGENVDLGRFPPQDVRSAHPSTYEGSISASESCNTATAIETRPDQAGAVPGSCTDVQETRVMCEENQTSCDSGTNCLVEPIDTITHRCTVVLGTLGTPTATCEGHPSYSNCRAEPLTKCEYGANDQMICTTTTSNGVELLCDETSRTFCDRETPLDQSQCSFNVQTCAADQPSGVGKYISPITSECQNNGIILLTDGMPTVNESEAKVKNLLGIGNCAINDYNGDGRDDFSDYSLTPAGACGVELAKYMSSTDINSGMDGKQNIKLFTVGLALSVGDNASATSYLKKLAKEGEGGFFMANSRAGLVKAFKQAISSVDKKPRAFSAPTYSVDTSTMLTHGRYVYVPIFAGMSGSFGAGNLKKYELSNGELYGKNMVKATDLSGKLIDSVSDLWSASAESKTVIESGGATSKLNPDSRNIFTDNGSSLINISRVRRSQLGAKNSRQKTKMINYIRGKSKDGTSRFHMGDIIHSKPVQLMTGSTDSVVFVGTNEGYIHAFQSSTGEELFAYMPKELLKNIKPQFLNKALGTHLYGVDGPLTLLDENNNGVQEPGESATIFFGLRRGGKAYYALDVTDPKNPSLKWKFKHRKLGYTWSQPTVAKLKYGGSPIAKKVLIFGGGYVDDNHLDSNTPDKDRNIWRVGASVFIINAETGALIKRISSRQLKYAVPSKIKVLDVDRNGSADRLYFTDTGGHVLRVDLDPNKDNSIGDYRLTKLASLGGRRGSNQRKFFNEPDVALFKRGAKVVLSVSVGSGKRPKPLDTTVDNYFYMLLDENVFKVPTISQNITPGDLYKAPLASSEDLLAELAIPGGKRGWKIPLDQTGMEGEKSLSPSITFQNKVMFTTFGLLSEVPTNTGDMCGIAYTNQSSLYVLDLLSGKAALDLNGDGSVDDSSDSAVIIVGGGGNIPSTPQVIRQPFQSSTKGACTNTDCIRPFEIHAGLGKKIADSDTKAANPVPPSTTLPRTYWIEMDQ